MARKKTSYYKRSRSAASRRNVEWLNQPATKRPRVAAEEVPQQEQQQQLPLDAPLTLPHNDVRSSTPTTSRMYDFPTQEVSPIRPLFRRLNTKSVPPPPPPPYENQQEEQVPGRRLVNIQQFLDQIRCDRHLGMDCSFLDCDFVKEVRKGFQSTLHFKCRMCHKETLIDTDKRPANEVSINEAMVTGAVGGGGGYANLCELAAAVNMPCMAQSTYIMHERRVGRAIEEAALESMLAAGREEKRLAEEAGDRALDGTPQIRVIADGMWSKRSYKNKYNALSGTASIVGWRTKKILFCGVRNKHCFSCVFAASKGRDPRPHECAKNWQGSSTGMETSIVNEGFHCSEEMHGLRYHELVADGDASVHTRLVQTMPYGPHEPVKKIECKNHLLRNFRSWLLELAANTKFPLPEGTLPSQKAALKKEMVTLRRHIKSKVERLSNAINKACKKRGEEPGTVHERVMRLRKDILNAGAHVFGQHTLCDAYFCRTVQAAAVTSSPAPAASCAPSTSRDCTASTPQHQQQTPAPVQEENLVPRLQKSGLWAEIMRFLNKMADHSSSLVHNVNTNMCEVSNSVVAKYLAGKRMFYSGRHSFNTRCSAAALSLNSSGQFTRHVHKKLQNGASPGLFTTKHNSGRVKRLQRRRKRKLDFQLADSSSRPHRRRRDARAAAGPDKDYGLGVQPLADDTETPEELHSKMEAKLAELQKDLDRWHIIEAFQQGSPEWLAARAKRLTACYFGQVCKRQAVTSCKKLVRAILYTIPRQLKDKDPRKHGKDTEAIALQELAKELGCDVKTCGLHVDRVLAFLAASPDAIIDDDTLAEIKCPVNAAEYDTIEEAIAAKALDYLILKNGNIIMNKKHAYFFQVQGQLHITGKTVCILYIYTSKWTHQVYIERDDDFWTNQMEPQLVRFYKTCLLPEIASPRYNYDTKSDDDIREPHHILKAQEDKEKNKQKAAERKREHQIRRAVGQKRN